MENGRARICAQMLRVPGGATMAVLSQEDWQYISDILDSQHELIEEQAMVIDHTVGKRSDFPDEVVNRIIAGENALRVIREWRGFSTKELALKARTPEATVLLIEEGTPKILQHLSALAEALDVKIDALL